VADSSRREWMASLTSHGRIFDTRKKGEDGGVAGEVDLEHRLEDGAGRKVSSEDTLILRAEWDRPLKPESLGEGNLLVRVSVGITVSD
jgi:hypothetical protein